MNDSTEFRRSRNRRLAVNRKDVEAAIFHRDRLGRKESERVGALAHRAVLFAGAVLLAVTSSLSAAEPRSSDAPILGVRGEPATRAVVRWSDMASQGTGALAARPARTADVPRPIRQDLLVPEGALVRMEARAEAGVIPSDTPPSPAPAASFEALLYNDDPNVEPPDTQGAVGPNHLMVTLNTQVRIQDRSGRALSTVTLSAFWRGVGGRDLGVVFDPRVLYDPYADRWITTALWWTPTPSGCCGGLLVGVSQTGNPTGSWNLYRVDLDPSSVDFQSLGFNKDWVVVRSTIISSDFSQITTAIWVFGKAGLYAGGTGSFTLISGEPEPFGGETQPFGGVPAVTLDPDVSALYLVQHWNGNADGSGVLRLHTITGSIGSEVLTAVAFVATPNPWNSPSGDICPQKGDPRKINCGGGIEVVFRNGTIWVVHAIFLPAGEPKLSAIQWWQLTPDGGVVQRGRLEDASGVLFYGQPSLAVNARGDLLLGFTSFSAQQFASGGYAYRAATDPPGTLRTERVFKAGEDIYLRVEDGRNRWGDYSATVVDPVNDTDFWTIQEYAAARDPVSGRSRWGTWWGNIRVADIAPVDRTPPRVARPPGTTLALPPREP